MVKCAQAGLTSKPGDLCNLQCKAQGLRCLSLSAAKANEARQARQGGVPGSPRTTWLELPPRQSLGLLQTGNGTQHYTGASRIRASSDLNGAGMDSHGGPPENGQPMSPDFVWDRGTMLTDNDFATRIWTDVATFRCQVRAQHYGDTSAGVCLHFLHNVWEEEEQRTVGVWTALVIWQQRPLNLLPAPLGETLTQSELICFKLGPVTVQWISRTKRLGAK